VEILQLQETWLKLLYLSRHIYRTLQGFSVDVATMKIIVSDFAFSNYWYGSIHTMSKVIMRLTSWSTEMSGCQIALLTNNLSVHTHALVWISTCDLLSNIWSYNSVAELNCVLEGVFKIWISCSLFILLWGSTNLYVGCWCEKTNWIITTFLSSRMRQSNLCKPLNSDSNFWFFTMWL
jgi:hypothetical protein